MPAGKRRRDLIVASEAQVAGLHEAAARGGRLLDWLDAAKPAGPLGEPPAVEAAPAPRRLRWPFGRKLDPQAEREQALLAELKAAVSDRPSAAERMRDQLPAPSPARFDRRDPQRAVG
jgi:hypothetical protein